MPTVDEARMQALELGEQARMLLAAEKPEEAKLLLDRALALDPMCPETYDHLGAWYMTTGDYSAGKEHFKKALLIDKHRGVTYFNLGNANMLLDEIPECLDNYNRALTAGFDQAEMQFFMALAYEQREEYDMALRHLVRAIMKDPATPDYKVKKAHILIRLDRLDDALETAEDLILSCPELFDGYHLRTVLLLRKEDYAGALKLAQQAAALFPEDVSLFLDYVRSDALAGNYDHAVALLRQAKQMQYFQLEKSGFCRLEAELCAQKGDFDRAVAAAREAIALEPEGTEDSVRFLLMNLLMAQKDYAALLEAASELVGLEQGNTHYRAALYYRALALRELGRKEDAQRAYREAITIYRTTTLAQPAQLDAYLYRAMALKDLAEYDKALEMIDFILNLSPDLAEPYTMRAEIYRAQGKDEAALAEMERAFALKPELRAVYAAE